MHPVLFVLRFPPHSASSSSSSWERKLVGVELVVSLGKWIVIYIMHSHFQEREKVGSTEKWYWNETQIERTEREWANQREREENDAISVIENQREWETGEFWDWEEGVHASSRECMCVWRGERSRRNKSNSLCCRFSWIDSLRTVPLDVVSRRLFVHLCKRRPVDGIGLKFGRIDKIPRRFHRLCVCVP